MSDIQYLQDQKYLNLIVQKINVSKAHKPKFGQGRSISLEDFQLLYGTDPFYTWFGLDNPLLYTAHKAAGGITSLYRQIGIGCEQLFRQLLCDQLGLTIAQATWSYAVQVPGRKERVLSLDGRITLDDLGSSVNKQRISEWMLQAATQMNMDQQIAHALKGVVFEVRQGYKSKDSKRQNADINNATMAIQQGYLPVVIILSNQIDSDIAIRYVERGWLLLRGSLNTSPTVSTYAFCEQILGYDLAGFLRRNSGQLKENVEQILKVLLTPSESADTVHKLNNVQDVGIDESGSDEADDES